MTGGTRARLCEANIHKTKTFENHNTSHKYVCSLVSCFTASGSSAADAAEPMDDIDDMEEEDDNDGKFKVSINDFVMSSKRHRFVGETGPAASRFAEARLLRCFEGVRFSLLKKPTERRFDGDAGCCSMVAREERDKMDVVESKRTLLFFISKQKYNTWSREYTLAIARVGKSLEES